MKIKLFEEFSKVGKWKIYAGLGGGVNSVRYITTVEGTRSEAEEMAYQEAISDYESYEGSGGIRSVEDIMEEDGIEDYDEAHDVYVDERESWLEYYVKPDDGVNESQNEEIEVKFVGKRNITQAFNVYKTRDGRITRIEKPNHVHIRFPFEVGQILNRNVEIWACNNGFYMNGKDTCPEEKIFGIRKSDIPEGHEFRMLYPHKFR